MGESGGGSGGGSGWISSSGVQNRLCPYSCHLFMICVFSIRVFWSLSLIGSWAVENLFDLVDLICLKKALD